jgi:hypothetical protein
MAEKFVSKGCLVFSLVCRLHSCKNQGDSLRTGEGLVFRIISIGLPFLIFMSCKTETYTINSFYKNKAVILDAYMNLSPIVPFNKEVTLSTYDKDIVLYYELKPSHTISFYFRKNDFSFIEYIGDDIVVNNNLSEINYLKKCIYIGFV